MSKKNIASTATTSASVALVSGNGGPVAERAWIKCQGHPRGGYWLVSSRVSLAEAQREHERAGRLLVAGSGRA